MTSRSSALRALAPLAALSLVAGCASTHAGYDDFVAVQVRLSVCTGQSISPLPLGFTPRRSLPCADTASCDEFLGCLGYDLDSPCSTFPDAACEGNVVATCDVQVGYTLREDCADDAANPVCVLDVAGVPRCGTGATCEPATSTPPRCEGDALVVCVGGVEAAFQCEGRCVDAGDRSFCATASEEPCESDRCVGSAAERCVAGVIASTTDCAAVYPGGSCRDDGTEVRCVPSPSGCDDGSVICEGSVARVCVDGGWVDIACGSFLGAGCQVSDGRVACVVE